jgi:hypothetical protein
MTSISVWILYGSKADPPHQTGCVRQQMTNGNRLPCRRCTFQVLIFVFYRNLPSCTSSMTPAAMNCLLTDQSYIPCRSCGNVVLQVGRP